MHGLKQLTMDAHDNAKEKGFWGHATVGVAEKLALMSTEIFELEECLTDEERMVEVADIVIRTLDLCGYLELDLPDTTMEFHWYPGTFPLAVFSHRGYRLIARTCQAHRKRNDYDVRIWLLAILNAAARYADTNFGPEKLQAAVEAKMAANKVRPAMHGARY